MAPSSQPRESSPRGRGSPRRRSPKNPLASQVGVVKCAADAQLCDGHADQRRVGAVSRIRTPRVAEQKDQADGVERGVRGSEGARESDRRGESAGGTQD